MSYHRPKMDSKAASATHLISRNITNDPSDKSIADRSTIAFDNILASGQQASFDRRMEEAKECLERKKAAELQLWKDQRDAEDGEITDSDGPDLFEQHQLEFAIEASRTTAQKLPSTGDTSGASTSATSHSQLSTNTFAEPSYKAILPNNIIKYLQQRNYSELMMKHAALTLANCTYTKRTAELKAHGFPEEDALDIECYWSSHRTPLPLTKKREKEEDWEMGPNVFQPADTSKKGKSRQEN